MTNIHDTNSPEHQLLLLLGELRGNMANVATTLARLEGRIDATEAHHSMQFTALSARITNLESFRIKIAGFTVGLAMFLTLTKDKLPAFLVFLTGG